ncbi:hypothetical protein A7311_13525 [Paenibacillus polymyxa]|nr:hypothetical protein A7311_13525 [Paenibacillus polymyxa]
MTLFYRKIPTILLFIRYNQIIWIVLLDYEMNRITHNIHKKGDLNLINESNTKLSEGRKLFRDFGEQVNTLAKEHDVTLNKK